MDRGIYASTSGGLLTAKELDLISNNLANVNTVGFKAERLISKQQEFADTLASVLPNTPARAAADQERTPGAIQISSFTDFSPGPISHTGNPLDVALREGNTFFVVQTPQGDAYTRAGNFTLNVDGTLVTADGLPVLGEGGPLTLQPGKTRISANGSVSVDGDVVGRLRTVSFADTSGLRRTEGARFRAEGAAPETVEADVVPESVEMPNVSVVQAMVDMITAQRAFEAYTKTARTIDELNEASLRTARTTG